MANLSSHTPIYVRTTGDDTTGDGSLSAPFATAQKAWDVAIATPSGDYVLDFGAGSFGGVTLTQDWPSRIAVRGAGATQSLLGGISGVGADQVFDWTEYVEISPVGSGFNVSLISDRTVDIGGVTTSAGLLFGPLADYNAAPKGGDVSLADCKSGSVVAGSVPWMVIGGTVSLTGCESGAVTSIGSGGWPSGAVSLVNSTAGLIDVSSLGGSGGSVTLTDSVAGDIASEPIYTGGSSGGSVSLLRSECGLINVRGNKASSGQNGGSGGSVSMIDSRSGDIAANGGDTSEGGTLGPGGAVYLAGSTIIPNSILAGSVSTVDLQKGRGVNGSSILGIA
jgi:hypothetical protein